MRTTDFGADFVWGVASAAFQIEGAPDADGKQPSVWDEMARTGRIAGRGGAEGIDFYHRYEDDIDLISDLGFGAKRISLSWPRLMGNGRDRLNERGAEFYDRVIDATIAAGMEPWVTVHHWDLPLALWHEGGWTRRGIVEDFAVFAQTCAERFGDRVRKWMVFNEPASVAGMLLIGTHERPGLHLNKTVRSIHHINLACAEAGRRMRQVLPRDAEIGTTNVLTVAHPYEPTSERTARRKRALEALAIDVHIDPAGGRGYPFAASKALGLLRRHIEPGDLDRAQFDYDFMGVQCYGPLVSLLDVPVIGAVPTMTVRDAEARVSSAVGIPLDADALLWTFRKYRDHPAARRMVVTEGGFGGNDRLDPDGRIRDDIRIWAYRRNLEAVLQAKSEGMDIDGYFAWSYADNIEWMHGRGPRFGIVYTDYDDDFRRIPKDSARWFQRLLTSDEGVD